MHRIATFILQIRVISKFRVISHPPTQLQIQNLTKNGDGTIHWKKNTRLPNPCFPHQVNVWLSRVYNWCVRRYFTLSSPCSQENATRLLFVVLPSEVGSEPTLEEKQVVNCLCERIFCGQTYGTCIFTHAGQTAGYWWLGLDIS